MWLSMYFNQFLTLENLFNTVESIQLNSYLYTILAEQSVSRVPFLIACNKQDEALAKGSAVVKALLEKEL